MFRTKLFLLRLMSGKKPAPAPSRRRVFSPPTGSTLITSAPMSASTMPHVGPMTMWVNSTTRRPFSGCGTLASMSGMHRLLLHRLRQARAPDVAVHRLAFEPLRHLASQRDQFVEVQAGVDAHAREHVRDVFR